MASSRRVMEIYRLALAHTGFSRIRAGCARRRIHKNHRALYLVKFVLHFQTRMCEPANTSLLYVRVSYVVQKQLRPRLAVTCAATDIQPLSTATTWRPPSSHSVNCSAAANATQARIYAATWTKLQWSRSRKAIHLIFSLWAATDPGTLRMRSSNTRMSTGLLHPQDH